MARRPNALSSLLASVAIQQPDTSIPAEAPSATLHDQKTVTPTVLECRDSSEKQEPEENNSNGKVAADQLVMKDATS